MEHLTHVELTDEENAVFDRLYSGLVAFQASALYYVSLGYDNAEKTGRAAELVNQLSAFRQERFFDPCGDGEVLCSNGNCARPGQCGPGLERAASAE